MKHCYDHACQCEDCVRQERLLANRVNRQSPRLTFHERFGHLSEGDLHAYNLRNTRICTGSEKIEE